MTKRGGLLNYTTSIVVEQTIGEILSMLVKGGASRITTDYEAGQPVGVAFAINTPYGVRGYRLPASIGAGTRPRKSAARGNPIRPTIRILRIVARRTVNKTFEEELRCSHRLSGA
jgi:hypothetical protein